MIYEPILYVLLLSIGLAVSLKPCLWKLKKHNWVDKGRVDVCSGCGLIIQKTSK